MDCARRDGLNKMTHRATKPQVLRIESLTVEYVTPFRRTPAARDLSLTIHEGQVYGLVGESGCGKSTVALAAMRYLPAGTNVAGEVNLLGQDVLQVSKRQLRDLRGNRMAMVYQDALQALNPSMTIIRQMTEILTVHEQMSREEARAECLDLLEHVQIADPVNVSRRYPHQLSGGMQQRVVIAMALLLKPSLLIMDEPTTGLDVTIEAAVLDMVNDLRADFKTAILFISHNLGVIARLCDRVGVMYAGEMVEEAPVLDLFQQPQHPYTMGLLDCIPQKGSSKREKQLRSIPGRVAPLHALPDYCVFYERCGMARSECRQTQPPLQQTGPGRKSRCLFWDQLDAADLRDTTLYTVDLSLKRQMEVEDRPLILDDLKVYFRASSSAGLLGLDRKTVKAVDGIDLELPAHKTLGIVGESGCGKSTLARAISGLAPVKHGVIQLGDRPLTDPVRKRPKETLQMLQMVFQSPESTLNPQKTVSEELRRPLRLFQIVERDEEDEAISQLLSAVNLDDTYLHRYPSQLSGGEKQRVAIARAFAGCPELVMCDEPTSSLDVSVQSMVLNLLQGLQDDLGVSMMFISHDLAVVRYISDYIGIVYLGKLCEFGPVGSVFRPPYHPYTEALLSAIPIPDPTDRRERIELEGDVPSAIEPPKGCRFHTRCPRKIGDICEKVAPEPHIEEGHATFCHIPRRDLLVLQRDLSL